MTVFVGVVLRKKGRRGRNVFFFGAGIILCVIVACILSFLSLDIPWVLYDDLILWDRLLSRATERQRGYRSLTGHDDSLSGGVFFVIVGIVRLH